jgi:hypothetical protein
MEPMKHEKEIETNTSNKLIKQQTLFYMQLNSKI